MWGSDKTFSISFDTDRSWMSWQKRLGVLLIISVADGIQSKSLNSQLCRDTTELYCLSMLNLRLHPNFLMFMLVPIKTVCLCLGETLYTCSRAQSICRFSVNVTRCRSTFTLQLPWAKQAIITRIGSDNADITTTALWDIHNLCSQTGFASKLLQWLLFVVARRRA